MSVKDLINNRKTAVKSVEVDGIGTVFVRRVEASLIQQLQEFESKLLKQAGDDLDERVKVVRIVTCHAVGTLCCESDGSPVFSSDNDFADVFRMLDSVQIRTINTAAMEFNKPEQQVADEKKE